MARLTSSDQTLRMLLEQGMTLQQAADQMGVTKQAVSLRLKGMGGDARVYQKRREAKRREEAVRIDREALAAGEEPIPVAEAAARYGWTRRNLTRAVALKLLPGHRVKGKWRVTPAAVRFWIDTSARRPGPVPGYGSTHRRKVVDTAIQVE